jgi:hypothetical protein
MAGRRQALLLHRVDKPDRPRWFAEDRCRYFVGFFERLYYMPVEAHRGIRAQAIPLDPQNGVNLLFVDPFGADPLARSERRGWRSSS